MNIKSVHNIYFIGIGGIGMSALARYFHAHGKQVAGYDKTPTPLTEELELAGIAIHYQDTVQLIPEIYLDSNRTLIVYTPAIPKNHNQLSYFINQNFKIVKRAEVLGALTQHSFCFAVAGTHGKTTTSAILGHILQPKKATTFLGGISENYQSNLILEGDEVMVVEADEFDRSFLQLSPNIACITSMDADHLDVYKQASELENSFKEFSKLATQKVFVAKGLPIKGTTYGLEDSADYSAQNIRIDNGNYVFDAKTPRALIKDITLSLPGRHNIMNAMAALAMANSYGVSLEEIKESLATFAGIQRRFSYKLKTKDFILIDDYAHHPTEIKAVAMAIKEMHPNQRTLVVFQPHLFSRTQDFADDFAQSLALFDEVFLLDIYPARELPIKGINSQWLLEKIDKEEKKVISKEKVSAAIQKSTAKIVAMLGAGDISLLAHKVSSTLKKQEKYEV